MDNIRNASPASSSASDSDAYNTESARIYFGPFKTPERKFAVATRNLFPPVTGTPLRRSPRLSSPRPRSVTPTDAAAKISQELWEDAEDSEQVVQLVVNSKSESEEEEESNSAPGTPQNIEIFRDEPSSALAEKIIHAHDNPSPPPSPPAALSLFDPYHTTHPTVPSTDYQADLMSLKLDDETREDSENSMLRYSGTIAMDTQLMSNPAVDSPVAPESLISFELTPPPQGKAHRQADPPLHAEALTIDDMLFSKSPSPAKPFEVDIPQVIVQMAGSAISDSGSPMIIDEVDSNKDASNRTTSPTPPVTEEHLLATPLRRSSRPRKSITPNPVPPLVTTATPSSARTLVKRKTSQPELGDEVISDSQDEGEDSRQYHSRISTSNTTTDRIRYRSPNKAPISFNRELGSLSPTSSNVLATLAFNSNDESNIGFGQPSNSQLPSFSAFMPPPDAPGPSTPVRAGPIRFTSPSKGEISPNKFQLQTPAPSDPLNTPARRIPISEAIVQGHVSPEKAAQLGYKPSDGPLGSMSTPARRVLVTDASAPSSSRLHESKLVSPAKPPPVFHRERPVGSRPVLSAKGKEKEKHSQFSKKPVVLPKLPFPFSSVSSGGGLSSDSSVVKEPSMANPLVKASPATSSLKQVTSRIPRIGAKPYTRTIPPAALDKPKTATMRMVDLIKSDPKPSVLDNIPSRSTTIKKPIKSSEVVKGKIASTSTSRLKTSATSTSTTLLKRKRDNEKSSPAKPRVIRQVPILPVPPPPPPDISGSSQTDGIPVPATGKNASQGPFRIRRVVVPESSRSKTPPIVSEGDVLALNAKKSSPVEPCEVVTPPLSVVDVAPESPMKEDLSEPPRVIVTIEQPSPSEEPPATPTPDIVATDSPLSVDSGLRRTTRSRKNGIVPDISAETKSRRGATSRRKAPLSRADDTFSGMSMTALKDLTMSNTMRNQRYLTATFETEVIRREGIRPESPAVKIKTIVQREQEEKEKQREQRARRRAARKSDEVVASSDLDEPDGPGYSSPLENYASSTSREPLLKHRRGAGEDEDYETPERSERQKKRTRLFADGDSDMDVDEPPKRRVKWDRGLFTTVYIDEVQLGSRTALLKENISLRSALAPTAKALPLDTLGNLPHTDSPLTDLVPENITVKKIVYDSDVPPPVQEVTVVKNTRSKRKK